MRENMSEEELVILDILTRPAPELSAGERDEVKRVAYDLLPELYRQKCSVLFEHLYESYPERDAGVYAEVG